MANRRSRIAAVETVRVAGGWRTFVFVVITTEDGSTGVGDATLEYYDHAVVGAVASLADELVGLEANRIEEIWQRLYRGGHWRGGPVLMTAISAIDQALWDLKGKALDAPVYELLGGPCRESVALYANGPRGSTPEELAASAARLVERGFGALKFLAAGPLGLLDGPEAIEATRRSAAAIRDRVGPDVRIAVDTHGRYSPAMVVRLAQALEPYDIWFLEEPVLPTNPDSLSWIARMTTIPLALGERLFSRWDFLPFFDAPGLALAQPDLAHCGGISEARRIATLAEMHDIGIAPHNPMSPINTLASAHLAMAVPNFVSLEYLADEVAWLGECFVAPLEVRDGRLVLPDRPGLGIELDRDGCRRHEPTERPWRPLGRLPDGSVAEW